METRFKYKFIAPYLIGINVLIFAVMFLSDMALSVDTLVAFGAKVNYKIVDGQLYRFLSAMFLHWDLGHLFANMFALYIFGRDLEIIFGRRKFLVIYFFAGLVGGLFSFIFNNSISAGASGAIFGLLGAHLYLFFRNRQAYKRIFGVDFLVLIGINIAYGFFDPRIDFSGHMGGLIGGFIICYLIGIRQERQFDLKKSVVLILTMLAIGSSFVLRSTYYASSEDYYIHKSIDQFNDGQAGNALNTLSKGIDLHPTSQNLNQLLIEMKQIINHQ